MGSISPTLNTLITVLNTLNILLKINMYVRSWNGCGFTSPGNTFYIRLTFVPTQDQEIHFASFNRTKWCPLCPPGTKSSELHLALEFPADEKEHKATGLRTIINLGLLAGLEVEEVYFNMLNGVNMKGEKVGRVDYLSLGGSLKVLFDRWLALW